ncbi:MAG TPA: hypothetical protein VFB62_04410, partial [Polyangiaceae bacterium]|nr:hypothetical protein [Polyangiaceae bacterium]
MPPAAATWFEPSKRIGTWKLITPIERDLAAPLWAAHDDTRVAYVRHFRVRSLKAGVRLDKVISWASGYEHANILPIFGVMDVEGGAGVAVISHYEEGQPLASVLQKEHLTRNRMPTPVAVAITLDLLEALHATGGRLAPAWSHGGLRPESILVTRGGRARIMELGATSV